MSRRSLGLVCQLAILPVLGAAGAHGAIETRQEPLVLPIYIKVPAAGTEDQKRRPLEDRKQGDQSYETVVLENEYVRVQLIPELGGVVYRAIHKPSRLDYFYCEGLGKNWYTFWESGVKASFPKAEHGMINFGQPASWRLYRRADGSATAAFWMEFSRHNLTNPERRGGFSRMLLSQLVTAIPAHWEARLLAAWLEASLPGARALEAEDPADPRVQCVLVHAAQRAGDASAAGAAERVLEQLKREPGAATRLAEFEALTRGEYRPPARLGQKQQ